MLFNFKGWNAFVEPGYAGLIKNASAITHGSLFCLDSQSKVKLDHEERWYNQELVQVTAYDGQVYSNVSIYTSPHVIIRIICN